MWTQRVGAPGPLKSHASGPRALRKSPHHLGSPVTPPTALTPAALAPPRRLPLQGQGSIIAFDKDPLRLQRLRDAAKQAGAASVIDARCEDFLTIDPLDPAYAEVGRAGRQEALPARGVAACLVGHAGCGWLWFWSVPGVVALACELL